MFIRTDVRQRADIEALVAGTVARFGRLDCAVNNAGISGPVLTPIADIGPDAWDETLSVNLTAVFLGMKYEIPAMLKNGGGAIVNVASIYGQKPSLLREKVRGYWSDEDRRDRLWPAGHPGRLRRRSAARATPRP
jgi:A-factor type gamma-butyrolactone 1'-reductase (1S-forming)